MKLIMENWRSFLEEKKEENNLTPDEAISAEGGAIGYSKWQELTGQTREELEKYVKDNDHIKVHKHGDIVDCAGLNEFNELVEDYVIDEGKICPKGKAWAMRKYGKWSAYAAMGASKYCKDPNYGKGKKNESFEIDEGALKDWVKQNWTQSDGTPCGDAKAQKSPKRCKPASKWKTMSKSEKAADNAKKKSGGKKGKQFVKATKKGAVTASHTNENYQQDTGRKVNLSITPPSVDFLNEEEIEESSARCTKVTKKTSSTRKGKKWMKCVKSDSGGYKRIHWGQAGVRVTGKSGNTKRKKSFKARHGCSKAKSNTPKGQACKDWAEE